MLAVWFKGHTDKDKRKKEVASYRNAFDELKKVLEQEYKKKSSVRDYEKPGWANQQIAVNEYNQVLEDIMKLLEI